MAGKFQEKNNWGDVYLAPKSILIDQTIKKKPREKFVEKDDHKTNNVLTLIIKWTRFNHQPHKMVKHTETIRRQ